MTNMEETWSKFVDAKFSNLSIEHRKLLAKYAGSHVMQDSTGPKTFGEKSFGVGTFGVDMSNVIPAPTDFTLSLLPMAMTIMAGLHLEGKTVHISDGPSQMYITPDRKLAPMQILSYETSIRLPADSQVFDNNFEEKLIEATITEINSQLKNYSTIFIFNLASSLATLAEQDGIRYLTLRYRVAYADRTGPESLYKLAADRESGIYAIKKIGLTTDDIIVTKDANGTEYIISKADNKVLEDVLNETQIDKLIKKVEAHAIALQDSVLNIKRQLKLK